MWMTLKVEYEPVNSLTNKQPFEQYLSTAPTRIIRSDKLIFAFANSYIDFLWILTDRIRELNAKFIRGKSGCRLARVLQFILKMVKYAPFERRNRQPLPEFLEKKNAIINIYYDDERSFGYAHLYLLKRIVDTLCQANRANLYSEEIFNRNGLVKFSYLIAPNDVHLYEDQLQMNIDVFLFVDDKGRACHPHIMCWNNHERVASLLYCKNHYAPFASISRLFSDITKHTNQKHFCLRCL